MNSPFNLSTLLLNKDAAKVTIFANGRYPVPLREHTNMLKVVGFIQNNMGISLQGNPRYEWISTVKTELEMMRIYHNNYNRDCGVYSTAQSLTKTIWGRTIPANNSSINIMHRPTRHAFCKGIYADKDMVNAHVSILCEAFKNRPEIDISALQEYNLDPKKWRHELALHHGLDPIKRKDDTKQLFIRILFGGSYEEWIKDFDIDRNIKSSEQHPLVLKIENQLGAVRTAFYDANPQIVKDLKKHNEKKNAAERRNYSNIDVLKRSLLACALQTIERWLMEACVSFLVREKGFDLKDIVPCQDGLMILKLLDYPSIEQDFERICSNEFGLNIKWVDKPFDEAIEIPDGTITKTPTEWMQLLTDDGMAKYIKEHFGKRIRYKRPTEDSKDYLYVFDDEKKRWYLEDSKMPHNLLNIVSGTYDIINKDIEQDAALTDKEQKAVSSRAINLLKSFNANTGIVKRLLCIADWCNEGFDSNNHFIGFENGFLDLTTQQFEEYREDIYITITTGYDYRCPDYEKNETDVAAREELIKVFKSMFLNDEDMQYYLQIMASGIDGVNYQYIWFFEGAGGNGKGLGLGLNECVLGNRLYKSGNCDILSADSGKANQSSEDICNLKSGRTIVFSEMDRAEGMTWSALKLLTGGEQITGRRLYKGLETFNLNGSCIGTFNSKPDMVGRCVGSEKASLERRLKPVNFPFIFTEDESKIASGGVFKRANKKYVSQEWKLSVRDVYLDLLCGVYSQFYDEDTRQITFTEPESIRVACAEYLGGEDVFQEIFDDLYFAKPDLPDIPENRIRLGDLYSDITRNETFIQGTNGRGRKAFLRTWSKKAFIEWCEGRFTVMEDRKQVKYIVGWVSKNSYMEDEVVPVVATVSEGSEDGWGEYKD